MTHVLMTADAVGGVWTYALELADALAPMDVSVCLATMGRPLDRDQRLAVAASAVVDVHESSYRLEWMQEPWREVDQAAEWLLELEVSERPDVVHLNGYAHGALPWRAPSVVVAHSCVPSWWNAVHGVPAPTAWDQYRGRVTEGLWGANRVVAPTRAMLGELHRWYGFAGGTVIPNGRRSDWTDLASKEPLILGAGRLWDEAKNLEALGRVAPSLPWPVMIAGEAEHPEGAGTGPGARAESEAIDGEAQLLGQLSFPELVPWLERASIFALPARYEPFGLSALEAGITGCALVLGDIPSLREIWGDAAYYVDPRADTALLAALQKMIAEPALVGQLGHRARTRSLELGSERCAAAYTELYQELLVPARAVAGASGGRR